MAFRYEAPGAKPLIQGEVLASVWDHRPLHPATEISEGTTLEYRSEPHPFVIVMSSVCDLERDFDSQFSDGDAWERFRPLESASDTISSPSLSCLLCDAYEENRIRVQIRGTDIWKRVQQNQDERYHHFVSAPIDGGSLGSLPDLYLDFRKLIAIPTREVYAGIRAGGIRRIATVPPIFVHDLIHRFYGYLSRVGVPTD